MTQKEFKSLTSKQQEEFLDNWNGDIADLMYEVAEEATKKTGKVIEYEQSGQAGVYDNEFYSAKGVFRISDKSIVKHFGATQIEFIPLDQLKKYLIQEVCKYHMN